MRGEEKEGEEEGEVWYGLRDLLCSDVNQSKLVIDWCFTRARLALLPLVGPRQGGWGGEGQEEEEEEVWYVLCGVLRD